MKQEDKWENYIKDPKGWIDMASMVFLSVPGVIIFLVIFVEVLAQCGM
tara:strand:+ start:195 stop:338 length:144 start_codon:yes stop_codon:yes gene_type:complete